MQTLPPVAGELAARPANYAIDERARALLRGLRPIVEPLIEPPETYFAHRRLPSSEFSTVTK